MRSYRAARESRFINTGRRPAGCDRGAIERAHILCTTTCAHIKIKMPNPCAGCTRGLFLLDWTATILLGAFVTSYWRGTWVLLDIWACGQPSDANLIDGNSFCFMVQAFEDYPDGYYWNLRIKTARWTYFIGLGLLFLGVTLLWSGAWVPKLHILPDGSTVSAGDVTPSLAIVRFLIVYTLGASAVCLWRGIWYWADAWILPNNPLGSYWTTSLVGSSVAFLFGAGASILAPPAIFLIDGPGKNPPPIAVTVLSSYYSLTLPHNEKPPKLPLCVRVLDVVGSFVFLPFAVVWFWRGTWLLCDHYFWGFSPDSQDLYNSKLWGAIFTAVCIVITSEPIVALVDSKIKNKTMLGLLGRLRTYILAWGTVSFWRVVWYVWDEFFGGTSTTSAWVSHAVSLACLAAVGCVSSIMAPASTMGVDAVPHEHCADEPLFSMLPIPYELLYMAGIARQESARKKAEVEMTEREKESEETGKRSLEPVEEEKEEGFLDWTAKMNLKEEDAAEVAEIEKEAALEAEEKRDMFDETVGRDRAFSDAEIGTVGWQERAWSDAEIRAAGSRVNMLQGTLLRPTAEGSRVSYFEMQRPQLHIRSVGAVAQRPSESNRRKRSNLYRSR
ncbi:hypothetical protein ACHAXT_000167 [Thalassiosira profunda]